MGIESGVNTVVQDAESKQNRNGIIRAERHNCVGDVKMHAVDVLGVENLNLLTDGKPNLHCCTATE